MNMHDCPVRIETARVEEQGKELQRSLRRLRIALNACDRCELLEKCTFRTEFNSIVDQVIEEVTETWNNPDLFPRG